MKFLFIPILFITIQHSALAQNNQLSNEKAKVVFDIITIILKEKEPGAAFVVANMSYKPIEAIRGIAARMHISKDTIEDTIAANYCRELIKVNLKKRQVINLKTFKEIDFNNRYQIINSRYFSLDTTMLKAKNKAYIEINEPIDGWDICNVFVNDTAWSGVRYMAFQIPRLCIPVFVYSNKKDVESFDLYLFRFEMQIKGEKFEAKFIDYKPL